MARILLGLVCLWSLAPWSTASVAHAETRVSGEAEPGLLVSDASLWARAGGPDWGFYVGAEFQGVARATRGTRLVPSMVVPVGLEATVGALQFAAAVLPPAPGQLASLRAELGYTVDEAFALAAEAGGPVAEVTSQAWALWLHVRLSPAVRTSCGGGRDLRPSQAGGSEFMLICLASVAR